MINFRCDRTVEPRCTSLRVMRKRTSLAAILFIYLFNTNFRLPAWSRLDRITAFELQVKYNIPNTKYLIFTIHRVQQAVKERYCTLDVIRGRLGSWSPGLVRCL